MRRQPAACDGAGVLNVAEIGCGAGARAVRWAERGHQVYGVDRDQARIALARRRAADAGVEILFDVGAASALPWPDRSMDVCIVPLRLWQVCGTELLRVLRPGGALYLRAQVGAMSMCQVMRASRRPLPQSAGVTRGR